MLIRNQTGIVCVYRDRRNILIIASHIVLDIVVLPVIAHNILIVLIPCECDVFNILIKVQPFGHFLYDRNALLQRTPDNRKLFHRIILRLLDHQRAHRCVHINISQQQWKYASHQIKQEHSFP